MRQNWVRLLAIGLAGLGAGLLAILQHANAAQGPQAAPTRLIDVNRSSVTVHVYKSGLFSAFAHNHTVRAPIRQGNIRLGGVAAVDLEFDSREMKVQDPEASAKERDEVQRTMLGPEVLDSAQYPEIRFRSTRVEQTAPGKWQASGELTLHGKTNPIVVEVSEQSGHYAGKARIKQTEFGITPIRIAGGTVKVKDEVVVEFEVVVRE